MAKGHRKALAQGGRIVRLPFPILGTDQGWALNDQPPGTTPNLLNVRALDWRNRLGGGKRNGHSKAIATQAGIEGVRRINGLAAYAAATGSPTGDASTIITVDDDFSAYAVAVPTDLGDTWVYAAHSGSATTGLTDQRTSFGTNANGLQFNSVSGTLCRFVTARFPTTNDVTATLRCRPDANTTNNNHGGTDDCTTFGPFIRGSARLTDLISARLRRNGADTTIQIRIERWVDDTPTTLGTSGNITISGGAAIVEDATLRLYEEGGNVIAVLNWPSESITNATLTVATSQNAGNSRAGVGVFPAEAGGLTTVAAFRTFARVQLTQLQPASGTVLYTYTRLLAGSNRYYIPAGFTSVLNLDAANQSLFSGGYDSATIPNGAAGNVDCVDTNTSQIRAHLQTGPRSGGLFRTSHADGPFIVEAQFALNNATLVSGIEFCIRSDATFKNYLSFQLRTATGTATQNTTEVAYITILERRNVTNGVPGGSPTTTQHNMPVRAGATWVRVVDDGENITIFVDGHVYETFTDGTFAGQNQNGVGAYHTAAAGVVGLESFRWIASSSSLDVAESNPLVAVFTSGKIQIANINAGTLSNTSGVGLANALPSAFSLDGFFYAVDGTGSKRINPSTLAVTDWANDVTASGRGVFPTGTRIGCRYRGRAVLARTSSQPWIWYMSRVGFPLDWEYLTANVNGGIATAAWYGTDADAGVPGDIITALIPFSDDYLYFGCAASIWMLEGDPGYDGAIQNVTYRTGVVGPRAWAFDDAGNLYFIGAAGLYRIARGGRDPVNVTGKRLINLLDALPLDSTLVQLAWDAAGGYLNIYLTPTDGITPGHHCIYDPSAPKGGAYWIDEYPVGFGPWGVCEITGSEDTDRRCLIGGNDGYIRRPDDATYTDDGEAIDSWVEIGPFQLEEGAMYSMVQELQAFIGAGSAAVSWYWFTADSPEEVAAQGFGEEVASGTWGGSVIGNGEQTPVGLRHTGGAHKVRIRQNTDTVSDTWSIERIGAMLVPTGRRRT